MELSEQSHFSCRCFTSTKPLSHFIMTSKAHPCLATSTVNWPIDIPEGKEIAVVGIFVAFSGFVLLNTIWNGFIRLTKTSSLYKTQYICSVVSPAAEIFLFLDLSSLSAENLANTSSSLISCKCAFRNVKTEKVPEQAKRTRMTFFFGSDLVYFCT